MSVTLPDAYWKFDESSGNATDATGGGTTLTNVNIATYGAGILNNAVYVVRASVQYLTSVAYSVLNPTVSISMSGWFYSTANPSSNFQAALFATWNNPSNNFGYWLDLYNDAGTPKLRLGYWGTSNALTLREVNFTPSLNTWYHIVATINFATKTLHIYVNAVDQTLTTTSDTATAVAYNGGSTFEVANLPTLNSTGGNWDGRIDESGFWKDYILSQAEVTELYNGGTPLAYPFTAAAVTSRLRSLLGVGQ